MSNGFSMKIKSIEKILALEAPPRYLSVASIPKN